MAPEPAPLPGNNNNNNDPIPDSAIARVLHTPELVETILYHLDDPITFSLCPLISPFFHSLIHSSPALLQHHYHSPTPPTSFLIWRYKTSSPVRTPIKPFDLHPKLSLSHDPRDLDDAPTTWDRTICSLHPVLEVQASISPRTVTDIKFSADMLFLLPTTTGKKSGDTSSSASASDSDSSSSDRWLNAYITQPPCRMDQLYVQKFVDIRRSAHRMKRHLAPEDGSFATLKKLKVALEAYRENRAGLLDRGGSLGEALKKFDGEKGLALFIQGFIHEDAVLVGVARERYPEAVDPAEAIH